MAPPAKKSTAKPAAAKKVAAKPAAATTVSSTVKGTTAAAKGAAKKKVGFGAGIVDNSKAAKKAAKQAEAAKKAPAAPREGVVVAKKDAKKAASAPAKKAKKATVAKTKSAPKTKGPATKAEQEKADSRTKAVEFRFLPEEFQEPQLLKFLNQFGANVTKCVVLRHKKTESSRGIALVTFDNDDAIPLVMDECNGMLLGGRTVRTRVVYIKRKLPPLSTALRRRQLDLRRRTRGARMSRFDNVRTTAPSAETEAIVGALIKHSKSEKSHNAVLKKMGINYSFDGFSSQLSKVPASLRTSKKDMKEKRKAVKAAAAADQKKTAKKSGKKVAKK